ncbi:Crp/Fnr family transcriptional regulator [Microcoleus sp. FACHB-SPT15]|uniref:Crp/Fnr family transcriptional regulator n=1 Tax=Microcoleus sp. FACHB-SPT15 TaxID=2692830 RepID=UPI001781768C|nr:Crp/Fnr family transcriptional regulator [Microcoleus sp. FACHB-SPT15]MBD1806015.1 Crp/Fnr family transcriptional regulator [Microcoleus sp. FACHB-SPT15]
MSLVYPPRSPVENRLLSALTSEFKAHLLPNLERVELPFKEVLYQATNPIDYVYFPNHGVVSLVTILEDSTAAEVAVVGNEGMVGLPIFLGVETSLHEAIVQVPGEAMRMKTDVFKNLVKPDSPLHALLLRYTNTLMLQLSQSTACISHHSVEERCCRWLLMTCDRVHSDQFPITHDFLAKMLAVRRASVTVVAGMLQKAGLIRYSRGQMTILDHQGLEAVSCECYRRVKEEEDRLEADCSQ